MQIPPVANKRRRKRAEKDIYYALRTYFPDVFYADFTQQRRAMVEAIVKAATFGGDQAIAAPRGEGKTSITECVVVMLVCWGRVRFPLIVAATGPDARRILANIKGQFERNEILGDDYPEVCFPVQALEGKAQRAPGQTVDGERTYLKWAEDHVILPTVDGSKASGSVLMTRGLDAAVRGIKVNSLRPDLIVIDDPETRESAQSELQIEKRELTIDEDLGGSGGGGKRMSRLMLTTIMRRGSLSDKFTDPNAKPSWSGERMRFVEKWPDRVDMWEDYVGMRQANQQAGDQWARGAHAFLLDNYDQMHAGSVVSNPSRFVGEKLPDGTQQQVSALQFAFDWIADKGRQSFDCELQNDPPELEEVIDTGLTPHRIQRQVSGLARRIIPPGASLLTQGIDVGKRRLHWVVRAWMPDGTGYTIDYGITDVVGTVVGSDQGLDVALGRAIDAHLDEQRSTPYATAEGQGQPIHLTLIDAAYRTSAIYSACGRNGLTVKPAMGFGRSAGCAGASFTMPLRKGKHRKLGDGWFIQRQSDRRTWLVSMDSDKWKSYEHDRWLTDPGQAGTMLIYGLPGSSDRMSHDERSHNSYAHHITAESEVEEVVRGRLVRHWKSKRNNNHWLDASYMANVAAAMEGTQLRVKVDAAEEVAAPTTKQPRRLSIAQLQQERRRSG